MGKIRIDPLLQSIDAWRTSVFGDTVIPWMASNAQKKKWRHVFEDLAGFRSPTRYYDVFEVPPSLFPAIF